jgi:hypothetical protein
VEESRYQTNIDLEVHLLNLERSPLPLELEKKKNRKKEELPNSLLRGEFSHNVKIRKE